MIDISKAGERSLQRYRFRMALPHIRGDVMDFGANQLAVFGQDPK